MKGDRSFKYFSIHLIWFWLICFALVPFLIILSASFLSRDPTHLLTFPLSLSNYVQLFNILYVKVFGRSFWLAAQCTLVCLIIAYPFAYMIARRQTHKNLLLLLMIVPFWTSSIIRTYAMIALLKAKGILNLLLLSLGIIHTPLQLLYTNTAVMIGLVYNLLPFMILPLYANIERLDKRLLDAAKDLGAKHWTIFSKIIFPLTLPGIIAGSILVFLPAMTLFFIPDILGGAKSLLLGNLIQQQFLIAQNWPLGASISMLLSLIMLILLWIYWHNTKAKDRQGLV